MTKIHFVLWLGTALIFLSMLRQASAILIRKKHINVMEQIQVREWFSLYHFWRVLRQSLLVGISLLCSFSDSKVEDAEM